MIELDLKPNRLSLYPKSPKRIIGLKADVHHSSCQRWLTYKINCYIRQLNLLDLIWLNKHYIEIIKIKDEKDEEEKLVLTVFQLRAHHKYKCKLISWLITNLLYIYFPLMLYVS